MASGFSSYYDNYVLNGLLRQVDIPKITPYLALFKTNAGLDSNTASAFTEVNTGGYARVAIPVASISTPSGSAISNITDIAFAAATDDWPTVTYVGIMDSAVEGAGNCLAYGELVHPVTGASLPRTIAAGDTLIFREDGLHVTLTNTIV